MMRQARRNAGWASQECKGAVGVPTATGGQWRQGTGCLRVYRSSGGRGAVCDDRPSKESVSSEKSVKKKQLKRRERRCQLL